VTVSLSWDLESVAAAVSGTAVGDGQVVVERVSTDSRGIESGTLFVAINGERFDGHDYAADALGAGATAVVVEHGRSDVVPRVEVADTSRALLDLAIKRRSELEIPVVAITGSTGKTTTKDLVHAGLTGSWASPRSFNNEVGVPLTVLSTPNDATALVIEVGSRGKGHIKWLTEAVRPDVAVITNLGVVHLETFGSREGLADAKYELVEMLAGEGTAVLPYAEPALSRGREGATILFGRVPQADIAVGQVSLDGEGRPRFDVTIDGQTRDIDLAVPGGHQADNAAAALGVAVALGADVDAFVAGMSAAAGSDWRMDIHHGRYTVVNDAYNANPQSVSAALETVAAMSGRSIAVLGVMAELGPVCEVEHREMGRRARDLGFEAVIVVGEDHGYALGAPDLVVNVADFEDATSALNSVVQPGDVVLVKASRSAGLEQLAMNLSKDALT
jgi:UDP-N-acetylmuramoyl-tripeptide--D-alanyl-D-alanine ligase